MIKTAIALALVILATAPAQDDLAQLVANRDKKLASPFLRCGGWTTSYDDARAAARAGGKLILGYFTRSYAPCGPCMQLEQTILSKPEFLDITKGLVLFCHLTTHIPSDKDKNLFAEKGGTGFPTLMVLDAEGRVLARHCGERSLSAVRDLVKDARCFAESIARYEQGACERRHEVLAKRIEYGHLTADEARAEVKTLGTLSPEMTAWFDTVITSREYAQAMFAIRIAEDDAAKIQAAKKLVDMKNAGHVPTDANSLPFWDWVMGYAANTRDVKLFEEGLVALTALLPDQPETRERLREKHEILDRMKREVTLGGGNAHGAGPSRP